MENKVINVHVVEDNRASLTKFAPLFAKRIFKAVKVDAITDFASQADRAANTRGIFLTRNISRYKALAIDITSVELAKGLEEGEYEVVLNRGRVDEAGESVEVRCPIDDSNFTKAVNEETLVEALKNGKSGNNIFFSSGKELARFLNAENAKEQARVRKLKDMLDNIDQMLDRTSEKNTEYAESYYRQLDGKTTAHVHVEINDQFYDRSTYRAQCNVYNAHVF